MKQYIRLGFSFENITFCRNRIRRKFYKIKSICKFDGITNRALYFVSNILKKLFMFVETMGKLRIIYYRRKNESITEMLKWNRRKGQNRIPTFLCQTRGHRADKVLFIILIYKNELWTLWIWIPICRFVNLSGLL
uniref:Uncharacterized protein n=1 Tax=Cacopsylla melanoneura TaxID=428564 RepID=A0A8D8WTM7_9HEMI